MLKAYDVYFSIACNGDRKNEKAFFINHIYKTVWDVSDCIRKDDDEYSNTNALLFYFAHSNRFISYETLKEGMNYDLSKGQYDQIERVHITKLISRIRSCLFNSQCIHDSRFLIQNVKGQGYKLSNICSIFPKCESAIEVKDKLVMFVHMNYTIQETVTKNLKEI